VRDANNEPIRWIEGIAKDGVHRASWDLRLPPPNPINLTVPDFIPPWAGSPQGPLVAPGKYSVELYVMSNEKIALQGTKQEFTVKAVHKPGPSYNEVAAFQKKTSDLSLKVSSAGRQLGEANEKLRYIKAALTETASATPELFIKLTDLNKKLFNLRTTLYGDGIRQSKDESTAPSISSRVGGVIYGHWNTTELPTETQKRSIDLAQSGFDQYLKDAAGFFGELKTYELELEKASAPYTPGRQKE
jgi:hypothetical protein